MANSKFRPFPFRPFPKEYMLGTDGIREILIPVLPVSVHSQNAGNGRERTGTDEPKKGLYFLSFGADGRVVNQGFLLALKGGAHGES